jgi:hypothetical protein
MSALDEEHAGTFDDDGSDTDQGELGELAVHEDGTD